jgi:hypothetical protein
MIRTSSFAVKAGMSMLLFGPLLQGCSVGPKYKAPTPGAGLVPFHNLVETPSGNNPTPALDQWWTGFNDPMLVTIVQRALNQNLDLAASLERVNQARAVALGVGARLYPKGELDASATAERQSLQGNFGTVSKNAPGFKRDIFENTIGPAASWKSMWPEEFVTMRQRHEMKFKLLRRTALALASWSRPMLLTPICRFVAIKHESPLPETRSRRMSIC